MGFKKQVIIWFLIFFSLWVYSPFECTQTSAFAQTTEEDLDDFFNETPEPPKDDTDTEDLDDFFQEESESTGQTEPAKPPDAFVDTDSKTSINGSVSLKTGYRFSHDAPSAGQPDHRGLSKAAAEFNIELRAQLSDRWDTVISAKAFHDAAYEINGRNQYPGDFLDETETEFEWDETYLRGTLSDRLDIKIGRQIVVWGKSDNIRVTDILNPLDLREPGMTDIEDLRLPVFMTRLDYYLSNFSLTGYLIHEHRSNRLPVFGSPYYFLPSAVPDDSDPPSDIENTEFALSLAATFQGMDVAIYAADVYDNTPFLTGQNQSLNERIQMIGLAANIASGNFLLKGEAAYFDHIRLSGYRVCNTIIENPNDYSRLDLLAGLEYSGFDDTTLGFEVSDRWLVNHDTQAQLSGQDDHIIQYAIRGTRTFLHEVLELTLLISLFGDSADDGGFIRAQGTYDLTDDLAFTLGTVVYQSGPSLLLKEIGENDTIFLNIVYSF